MLKVYDRIKPTYVINITNDFSIEQRGKIPNKFHRLMMKLFLGWEFEILNENRN